MDLSQPATVWVGEVVVPEGIAFSGLAGACWTPNTREAEDTWLNGFLVLPVSILKRTVWVTAQWGTRVGGNECKLVTMPDADSYSSYFIRKRGRKWAVRSDSCSDQLHFLSNADSNIGRDIVRFRRGGWGGESQYLR